VKAFAIYIRCISLPLCGGLMLAFYLTLSSYHKTRASALKTTVVNAVAILPFYTDVLQAFIPTLKKVK
jgi:hypothetical protein